MSLIRLAAMFLGVGLLVLANTSRGGKPGESPPTRAYFGDLHVHTAYSLDAFGQGNRSLLPADALRFARGEPITHPGGQVIQLAQPLDFVALTDHGEFLGETAVFFDPEHPLRGHPIVADVLTGDLSEIIAALTSTMEGMTKAVPERGPLFGSDSVAFADAAKPIWKRIIDETNRFNTPDEFTTLIGFEWTAIPNESNLHRVVILDGSKAPAIPANAIDQPSVESLWDWMEGARSKVGGRILAIPHNSNMSNGLMFLAQDTKGNPIDRAYAKRRAEMEPLVEIFQIKGASESHPRFATEDEWIDFEIMPETQGLIGGGVVARTGFVREALKQGLTLDDEIGANPFKLGIIASTDNHASAPGDTSETRYVGGHGSADSTPELRRDAAHAGTYPWRTYNPGGLAAVWAPANTRDAIFSALERRETFGTSGPRIQIRLFGGWDYPPDLLEDPSWPARAYREGVAMGSDLPPATSTGPLTLVVWAARDPNSAALERIQIIKGWTRDGQTFEKIYDVAVAKSPAGAAILESVWTDPDFDRTERAFYYARALESPTLRWSSLDARVLGAEQSDAEEEWIHERAWSSPLWYAAAPKADGQPTGLNP